MNCPDRSAPFEHQSRGTICQRSVDNVGVARDPADVRSTPVNVVCMVIENILMCHRGAEQIACRGVHYAFGLPVDPDV